MGASAPCTGTPGAALRPLLHGPLLVWWEGAFSTPGLAWGDYIIPTEGSSRENLEALPLTH